MSSSADSPVKISAALVTESESTEVGPECGLGLPPPFAHFSPLGSLWKTSAPCLFEGSIAFSETWPRSGMMRGGTAFELPSLAIRTHATVSSLLPTPRHCDGKKGSGARKNGGGSYGLGYTVARLLRLKQQTTTKFDPSLSELLMGFPIGWTDLARSETP